MLAQPYTRRSARNWIGFRLENVHLLTFWADAEDWRRACRRQLSI